MDRDGPQLVRAQELYQLLADADATMSLSFLQSDDPQRLRDEYAADLDSAAKMLNTLEAESSGPKWSEHLEPLGRDLPVYAGLIASAWSNSRLGYPVGAAYLRQASTLMTKEMLRQATELYALAADDLNDSGGAGTRALPWLVLALVGGALATVLVASQLWIAGRTRRLLNVGLLVVSATVLVVFVVTAWVLADGQRSLVRAQREGSDVVQLLASTRLLTLRAQTDASFTLIERGTGDSFITDFADVVGRIGMPVQTSESCSEPIPAPGTSEPTGLLAELHGVEAGGASWLKVLPIEDRMRSYLRAHEQVRGLDACGDYTKAVDSFLSNEAPAADSLDAILATNIDEGETKFTNAADESRTLMAPLSVLAMASAIVALMALLLGLRPRFQEYR